MHASKMASMPKSIDRGEKKKNWPWPDRGETVVILNFAVETPNFAVETPDFAVVPETPKIWQNQARIGKHHNHWF